MAGVVEGVRDALGRWADWAVLRLDQFFADPTDGPTEPPEYSLRLRLAAEMERGKETEFEPAFAVQLELPRLEKRWHVFLDNVQRDVLPGTEDQPEALSRRDFSTGVGVDLARWIASRLSADAGLDFDPLPKVFAGVRFRHYFLQEPWKGMFTQRGYWKSHTGFGEITAVDFVRRFSTNRLARSNTAAKWAENTEGLEWQQTFSMDHLLRLRGQKVSPAVSVYGHAAGEAMVDGYRARLTWRTPFWKRWIFLNVSPQIEYPRRRDFEFTPSLRVALDFYAGALPEN